MAEDDRRVDPGEELAGKKEERRERVKYFITGGKAGLKSEAELRRAMREQKRTEETEGLVGSKISNFNPRKGNTTQPKALLTRLQKKQLYF